MKRQSRILLMLLMVTSTGGCASMTDSVIDCESAIRNKVLAQKAWGHWSWCYECLDEPYHFAKGFKAGYRNILDGGNGCQPTLAPQCYWKPAYQSPEGRGKTNAWFDGFSHGVLAANQDGYGHMNEIPLSPTARANIERASRLRVPGADGNFTPGQTLSPINMPPASSGSNLTPIQQPGQTGAANLGTPPNVQPPVRVTPARPYE